MRLSRGWLALLVAVAAFGWAFAPRASAQAFTPDQADRAAAVREGVVNWYTSTPFPLVQQLADKFTADTGIKVQLLRSGGEAVLRRFLQENQAGQAGADVITMSDAGAAVGLTRRGLFVPFRPDGFDKVVDGAKDPQGALDRAARASDRHAGAHRQGRREGPAEDLVRSDRPEVQGQDGDAGPVVHRDPAHRGRHAVAEIRLEVLPGAAHERHDDRAGPSAGVQDLAAGRAA